MMSETRHTLTLTLLPQTLSICRLPARAQIPDWAHDPAFSAITRTSDELSIVCPGEQAPAGITASHNWRALKVQGPLAFGLTGILLALAAPLAQAGIGIFAVSTYDTDYLLVQASDLASALAALRQAGHQIREENSGA